MFTAGDTERNTSFTTWTIKSRFWNLKFAEGTWTQRFRIIFLFYRSSCDLFYFCFKLRRYFVNIFRSNKNTRPVVCLLLKVGLWTFTYSCSHNVYHIVRKLANILAYSYQQTSSANMVIHFNETFCKLIAVYVEKPLIKIKRYSHARATNIFVGIDKNFMCVFVVSKFLFLTCDIYCYLNCLAHISDCPV